MADTFKLPVSSYEELVKIIKAYATGKTGQAMSLDDLSQSSGMVTTTISGNNGFLLGLDLISEGKAKAPTDMCIKLGRAYTHNIIEDIVSAWREIIDGNEFLNRMISAIRIRNGMDRTNLINHIIYSSGLDSGNKTKAGAGAVIEIFKFAGIVEDNDGKITARSMENPSPSSKASAIASSNVQQPVPDQQNVSTTIGQGQEVINVPIITKTGNCQIILNLNLNGTIDDLDELSLKVKKFIQEISE